MSKTPNYFTCPKCKSNAPLKYRDEHPGATALYYGCKNDECRCHFRVLSVDGLPPHVTHKSPDYDRAAKPIKEKRALPRRSLMTCPRCEQYGVVDYTEQRTQ
jgi:transcription elongation factor Elf1